ncbi:hypothetical protein EI427_19415 [Flammeovirga pectinis]|uniref:Toxin-antitoxin system YwqK family antitoxin n=1 Tax=Flammeovirga pectinis TaxID=2494373 RepID=A0A3S9P7X5_9BACT|nr:hypothetical protein [Flammeovirga pectinis]AZQ64300.1 hypothetical protein EI427_19415 [Flammeovirga pectinis]
MKRLFYLLLPLVIALSCDTTENSENNNSELTQRAEVAKKIKPKSKEGLIVTYHSGTKVKRTEINYQRDKKNGLAKVYYENGNVRQAIDYVNNFKHGMAKEYYKDGTLYKEAFYDNNVVQRRKYYYKDGILKSDVPYYKGKQTFGLKEYSKSGKLLKVYPKIQIKENDDTALYDKYILELTLSQRRKGVKFFMAHDDNKPVRTSSTEDDNLYFLPMIKGRGVLEIPIPKGNYAMKKFTFYVEYVTYSGRKRLDKIDYNFHVTNY